MSSEEYENCLDEFRTYYDQLKSVVKNKLPKLTGEIRKRELRNADRLLEDAEAQLTQMFEEAQSAPGAYRTSLLSQTRGHKSDLEKLKRELITAKSASVQPSSSGNRDDLLGYGGASSTSSFESQQRGMMQEGLDIMNRTSDSVARSQRIAAETDEYGVQILADLDDQKESLIRVRDKVKQTDSDLTKSRRIIQSIGVRMITNKLLLIVIIVLEVIILGAVVYIKYFKK